MPTRIFTVTGTPYGDASRTTAATMPRNRSVFHGSAAPPPLRVTLGTGQPKLRSMWSARSSVTRMRAARPAVTGSTEYSCTERGFSSGSCEMSRIVSGVRSTSARVVTISDTYRLVAPDAPPASRPAVPYSRHSRRKARLVMPAIGASTTGDSTT